MVTVTVYKQITEAYAKGKPFKGRMPALDQIRYVGEIETAAEPLKCYGKSIPLLAKVVAINIIKRTEGDVYIRNEPSAAVKSDKPLEGNELTRFKTCLRGALENPEQSSTRPVEDER